MKINLFTKFWWKLWLIKEMYSHDGVYLHLMPHDFVPRWPNQSCVSLILQVFIIDWLLMFVNQTQEGADWPFAVTRH